MKHTFERYRDGYAANWRDLTIRPARLGAVTASVSHILAGRPRYEKIEQATGVPWFVVGIIHKMEANLAFDRHLHNGDPLTRRTRLVPKGRPVKGKPPFTWEESAIDALTMPGKEFHKVTDWTVERIAYCLELYNGFGYRKLGVPSPYLWSFTTAYTSGKYVRDHVWDPNAVSQQSGAMALLRVLADRDVDVRRRLNAPEPVNIVAVDEGEVLPRTPTIWQGLAKSRTILRSGIGALGAALVWVSNAVGNPAAALAEIAGEATAFATSINSIAELVGVSLAGVGLAAVGYGVAGVILARISAEGKGKVA